MASYVVNTWGCTVEVLDACPICGGTKLLADAFASKKLNLAPPHAVVWCTRCSVRFLNPRPTLGQYLDFYTKNCGDLCDMYPVEEHFYADEGGKRIAEYGRKLKRLKAMGASGRLLDIGACTGEFLDLARRAGFEVEGIEPSEVSRSKALEQYGLVLRSEMAEEAVFPAGTFDVIFCSHLLEHLMDPLRVARLMHTWLKPGGLAMVEVPNQFGTFAMMRARWKGRITQQQRSMLSIHHTFFFSRKSLKVLASTAGFQRLHIRNVYYSPVGWHPRELVSRMVAALYWGSSFLELVAQKR